ncbi:putative Ig domain-containing protein [Larkinella sp. C7]|uniref:putative Ig domain-containing protein n=1 Tax=Larkinella sp. C7 TaxID=2576607 RepID=UPI001486A9A6|nr:putative Ig domain-containing protein [Larkinella sp. C7]
MRTKSLRFLWLLTTAIGLLGQTSVQAGTFIFSNKSDNLTPTVALPGITTQPVSQTVCSTSPASFSVAATNATSYRWQVSYDNTFNFPSNLGNTGVYSGADTPVLTISSVSNLNGAYFRCVVTNGGESTNSEGVLLTVTTLPTATISYTNSLLCTNGSQQGVSRSGNNSNGGVYSSSPSSLSLTSDFGAVMPGSSTPGSYTVTYTVPARGGCPVVTATTTLTITAPPTVTGNAVTQPTCSTPTGTISVTATGSGTIEYSRNGTDWQSSGTFSGLNPGSYTIRARSSDNLTCTRNITFMVNAAAVVTVSNPTVTTATTGSGLSRNFTASGGTGLYSYSVASGTLPNGLSLATTGVLSGTPTEGGSFTITVRATGNDGCSGVGAPYILDVTDIPVAVITTGPVSQTVCSTSPASFSVAATNATSYLWQRSADNTFNFPSNLSNSGVYSGTDTPVLTISSVSGLTGYFFRCVVSNAGGPVNSNGASITVTTLPTVTISYINPLLCTTGGTQGLVTRSGFNNNGGTYSSSPSSLSLSSSSGSVTTASSTPGSYTVTYTVPANGGCPVVTATTTLTITAPPTTTGNTITQPTCAIPTGTISVTATGSGTIEYSRNGTDWQTTGLFSGLEPNSYVIRVRSSDNPTCTRNLGFTINTVPSGPTVSNPDVTTATVGTAFSRNFTASGGTSPYSYSVASGTLPNGLSLATTGVLSGTPTESGSFTITVRATGNNGCSGLGSAYVLIVGDAPSADLYITKTDGVSSLAPGTPTTYTITVSNAGPLAVTGATVTDNFPASITSVAWTATFTGGASGTGSGTGNISQQVNLPVGGSVTYVAVCETSSTSTGSLSNTASVSTPGGITDPNTDNNSATDVNILTPSADLVVAFSDSPDPVGAGNNLTYTGQVSNLGPSTASTVQLSIPLSASTTFFSLIAPGGWSCTTPPVGTTGTVSCSRASFPTAGTASFTLVVATVPGAEGNILTTTATVSSGITDPNSDNNTASVNTSVVSGSADLSSLTLSVGSFSTAFFPSVTSYSATVGNATSSLTVTPTSASSNASIQVRVNGGSYGSVASGAASDPLALTVGANSIEVRVTAEDGLTTKTYRVTVTRGVETPTIGTQPVSQTVCSSSPVSFSVSAGNATSYQWQIAFDNTFNFPTNLLNSGVYSGADTPVLTISSASELNGRYYRCVVSNGGGGTNSEVVLLTVTTLPTVSIHYNNTVFCNNSSELGLITRSGMGSNGGTYSSSPSSLSINSSSGIVTPSSSPAGSYTITYTVPASGGCPVVTATAALTVIAPPTYTNHLLTQPTCAIPTGTISITATGSGTIEYSRDGTDWQTSGVFGGLDPGQYYVIRIRSSDNPTCTLNRGFTINPVPSAPTVSNPAVTTATVGTVFSQTFTASGGTSPYSYSVASGTLPDGLSLATTGVLSGTPTESGSFTITVRATGSNGCSGLGSAYIVTVGQAAPFISGFAPSLTAVCVGSPVTFTATIANLTGSYSYTLTSLSNEDMLYTGTSSNPNFSQTISAPGSGQTFKLEVINNGMLATATQYLTVNALPVAGLVNNGPLTCGRTSVTLTASGGTSYTFSNGSGVVGTPGETNTVLVSSPGTYSVTVANASGCLSTTTTTVSQDVTAASVSISPVSATLTCASPTVSLSAEGNGTVLWSTGATTENISVSSAGMYSVTLTAGNSCTASASVQVSSNIVSPSAPNLTSTTVTQGAPPVTLIADNCAGTLTWTGPGGATGTGSITVTTASPGTFIYEATCTVNDCVGDPASVTVVVAAPAVTGSFDGFIYGADCATFRGWVWDRNKPNTVITIDILDGTTVIATIPAGEFRQDLLNAGKGNGRHAFFWPIPDALKDGLPHSLSARVTGNNFVLKDSPKVLICEPNTSPGGNKPPQPPTPTVLIAPLVAQVGVPFSGTLVAFTDPEGGSLSYNLSGLPAGLSLEMPSRIISGTPTESGTFVLTYQATDPLGASNSVSFQLTVNPAETTTVTGSFEGYLDKLDCGGIRGWVWDRNKPNTPLTVEFYTESSPGVITVLGSTLANIYRQDLKDAGKGNGAHAYNFTPPSSVTNGTSVLARVLGSSFVLKGSPKTYQCAPARLSAEQKPVLEVAVLGNPIHDYLDMEIRGAEGQPLTVQVTDLQGRIVAEQHISRAGVVAYQRLSVVGQSAGLLVLQVRMMAQVKTVTVLKTN